MSAPREIPIRPGLVAVPAGGHDRVSSMRALIERAQPMPRRSGPREVYRPPLRTSSRFGPVAPGEEDPVLQSTTLLPPLELAPTIAHNFEGLGMGFAGFNMEAAPPDTSLAVGLTQYVEWVNLSLGVFDKSSGAWALYGEGNFLWSGFGGPCETTNRGEPMVQYDRLSNYWVLSQNAYTVDSNGTPNGSFTYCFAIVLGPDFMNDPLVRYWYSFPNYTNSPKLGIWPDAYYTSFNMFNASGSFVEGRMCAFPKFAMFAGQTSVNSICFASPNYYNLLPADIDGSTPPPGGSPEYFLWWKNTAELDLYKFHIDFANTNNTTLTGPVAISVASFTPLCSSVSYAACVPQPVTSQLLDGNGALLMHRLAYRNYGDHESLAVSHSVAPSSNGGVRWYEIRSPGGTPTVTQQSTFAPDSAFRWMPSIAMDHAGDMAMGYSVSSTSTYPSLAMTGRLSSDTASTMQTETTIVTGSGYQGPTISTPGALSRWGDYSTMQVDPVDDCTFWYAGEYQTANGEFNYHTRVASMKFTGCGANNGTALRFVPTTPCRISDTRNPNGSFGGPFIAKNSVRAIPVQLSGCGVPSTAQAYSLNVTVVPHGALGYLTMFPCGQTQPLVSTINSDGRTKAVAAIMPAGTPNGSVCAFASNDTDLVLDINGYFISAADPSAPLAFFPIAPCRIADTRNANGPLGGPMLNGNASRTFPILSSTCGIPNTAQAYSLNFTVVPQGALGYLTTWPTGLGQPLVSTLNAPTGTIVANAAIVPAGSNGSVDVFVTNNTHLVIDVNGYFAPMTTGGLSLYNVPPCRVLDTRIPSSAPTFNGRMNQNVNAHACMPTSVAKAFVLNATVVPPSGLGYITLWPQGSAQPVVSTLNAVDGAITSNMAIVPTSNGTVSVYSSNPTHLVLDVSGLFAP